MQEKVFKIFTKKLQNRISLLYNVNIYGYNYLLQKAKVLRMKYSLFQEPTET